MCLFSGSFGMVGINSLSTSTLSIILVFAEMYLE